LAAERPAVDSLEKLMKFEEALRYGLNADKAFFLAVELPPEISH
jgi:hypothetical protein